MDASRPLRIQYLVGAPGIPVLGPSGASAHVRGITRGLADLGHHVELVAVRAVDARGAHGEPAVPWSIAGLPGWPSWLAAHGREVRASRRVAAMARQRARGAPPVDLLMERHALFSDAGLRLARALRVPLVLEVNAPQALERARFEAPVIPRAGRGWEQRVLRAGTQVVAVSRWLVRWLVEEVGCDPARVHHVPNGVLAARGAREATRAALGFAPDDLVIGFLGSFRPWHGTSVLPDLLRALPQARLLLVGPADATVPGFSDLPPSRVRSTGQVRPERVPDLVAAMDVGLAPYPADAPPWFCPLKILEYRAQGTPVVTTDVADARELTGEGGTVVEAGRTDALAEAIRRWHGHRCRPWIRSWEDVAREVLAVTFPGSPVGSYRAAG